MQYSSILLLATLAISNVYSHGIITSITGANGVTMPGLSVIDGTPRDCATPKCGAEADTSIIRTKELGTSKASALGRTEGGGPVDAAKAVSTFFGSGAGNATAAKRDAPLDYTAFLAERAKDNGGVKTAKGTVEDGVAASAGKGATSGLPTAADDGTVTMTFHQVNQDGAGALTAAVDPTSGGTEASAFQPAEVTQNVPGSKLSLSGTTTTDFPVTAKIPAGTVCSGTVAGVQNVCVMKLQNNALAGPFGGSVAFTQSAAAKKRAIEYNLSKRRFARALWSKL